MADEKQTANDAAQAAPVPAQAVPLVGTPGTVVVVQPTGIAQGLDETVPGGRYRVGDTWVDAEGQPVKK